MGCWMRDDIHVLDSMEYLDAAIHKLLDTVYRLWRLTQCLNNV